MLENLSKSKVFYYFEQLCQIPHGSGNVDAISDYCVNFAKERNLKVRQDELFNVVIVKEASAGYEDLPTVILQGHLDMVCEKNVDVTFDFEKDPLNLGIDGDYIHANGTTLGGDDGIAIAMCLAILDDDSLVHPRLEAVFTTEEEVGLDGARFIDASDLQGKYMINLDSEEEGIILTSCAGGVRCDLCLPVEYTSENGVRMDIKISGLLGGHSGTEINKMRANANVLMGRLVYDLYKEYSFNVISLNGGLKDNAIPRESFISLCVDPADVDAMKKSIEVLSSKVKNEYSIADPSIEYTITVSEESEYKVLTMASTQRVLFVLFNAPNGIQSMTAAMPDLVESSLNLGSVTTNEDNITLRFSVRSSIESKKMYIADKLCYLTELMGGVYSEEGNYPGWEFKKESKLRTLASDVWEKISGKKPVMCAIHAGLECGLFTDKIPDIDIISIGPNMKDIHTPEERLSISSSEKIYNYVLEMLKEFPNYIK